MREDARIKSIKGSAPVSRVYQNPKKPEFKRLLREVQDASTGQWVDEVAYTTNWYDKSHHDGKPWNLDRVNGRLDGDDATRNEGRGVNIFVLDTGVDCEHDELRGRCENVGSYSNFFPGGYWRNKADGSWGGGWETGDPFKKPNDDFDGHGTHCAATAAGETYGIAPQAKIYGMKVLGRGGGGSVGVVLRALNSIYELVSCEDEGLCQLRNEPIVVSMSLGGPCKDCWDDSCGYLDEEVCAFETDYARVIKDLREINVLTVVAAGNSDDDACKMSPQAARYAITVGAIERGDSRAYYSNYGDCVDIMAPGTDIPSAAPDSANRVWDKFFDDAEEHMVMTGTSQACPLVAGILALHWNVAGNKASDSNNIVQALLNNAEVIDTDSPSSCRSNKLLAKAPMTTRKGDLNFKQAEHPCQLDGESDYEPPESPGGREPAPPQEDEPEDEPEDSEPDDSGSCASRGDDCDSDGDCCQKNGGATRSCYERRSNEAFGTCQTQCPDDSEYVCRSNYAPTPRPVAAPKSSGNYAPTYQPTENPDRRLAGAPTLRGSYSA